MYPVSAHPPDPHVAKIAALNDRFRRTFDGGRVFLTRAVSALPEHTVAAILNEVRAFEEFGPDNDPHDEHDFGRFEIDGQAFFWKIDYYDPALKRHSDDAADPLKTARVLTIMLSEDY